MEAVRTLAPAAAPADPVAAEVLADVFAAFVAAALEAELVAAAFLGTGTGDARERAKRARETVANENCMMTVLLLFGRLILRKMVV